MTDESKPAYELAPEPRWRFMRFSLRTTILASALVVALVIVGVVALILRPTPAPVWAAPPQSQVTTLAKKADLTILPKEGIREHIHAHLSITFNGQPVTVPANIGINVKAKQYSELHTHDTSGILHVESQNPRPFYLRQAFIEWNVPLGAASIDQYRTSAKQNVKVQTFVNQQPYAGDLRQLELSDRQDITISITTDGSAPKATAPFEWPKNY